MNEATNLTTAEIETLREMKSYSYYPFRRATAKKLAAKGLAETVPDRDGRMTMYRITEAGREILANGAPK